MMAEGLRNSTTGGLKDDRMCLEPRDCYLKKEYFVLHLLASSEHQYS